LGRGLVAGASVLGLGSLAYYGLGLSNKSGFIDRSSLWPQYVRDRIRSTYQYFGTSLGITAAAAYAVSRNPTLMNLAMRNSIMAMFACMAILIGSGMVVRSIPYNANNVLSSKTLAWAIHAGLVGAVVAPMALLGGPLLIRAAWMTAGVIGGLSVVAATAPSEKFLNMGGPLAIGLGVVLASSIG
jgi:FtsH-binding integral membrane protein